MNDLKKLVWLDLCSGLGGASQPALDRGWKVIRVDIDPRFKPDIVADVRALPLKPFHVDVLWASPPCQDFSKWGMRCFNPNPPEPNLSIVNAIYDLTLSWPCRYWAVENVLASRRWFTPLFGPCWYVVPGHSIYSNLAFLIPNIRPHKGNADSIEHRWGLGGRRWGKERESAAEAAKIPYEIGEAICRAVEQRELDNSDIAKACGCSMCDFFAEVGK